MLELQPENLFIYSPPLTSTQSELLCKYEKKNKNQQIQSGKKDKGE